MRRILGTLVLGAMGLFDVGSRLRRRRGFGRQRRQRGNGRIWARAGRAAAAAAATAGAHGEGRHHGNGRRRSGRRRRRRSARSARTAATAGAPTGEAGERRNAGREKAARAPAATASTSSRLLADAFPATVEMGPTVSEDTSGAVLCADVCRVTSNAYSDGVNPCANEDRILGFYSSDAQNIISLIDPLEFVSTSAGTLDPTYIDDVPTGEAVTVVIENTRHGSRVHRRVRVRRKRRAHRHLVQRERVTMRARFAPALLAVTLSLHFRGLRW